MGVLRWGGGTVPAAASLPVSSLQLYREARECLTLLSQCLGSQKSSLEMHESDSKRIMGGLGEDTGSDGAAGAGAGVGSGSGQEVLGIDTGPAASGAVCGARAFSEVQKGRGRAARHRRGLKSCGALNVPFMQPWDRVLFRAKLAPPGDLSQYQV